jgi:hypothetical protein
MRSIEPGISRFRCGGLPIRAEELQRFLSRRKAAKLAVIRIVFGSLGGPEDDELAAFLFNYRRQFFTLIRRHIPSPAMRAFVVAHTGPLIGPSAPAAGAFVEIEKPGHADLLGSQAIITTRNEIYKSTIAQKLKLLTYLGFDVLVAGIEIAEMAFEGVDLFNREITLAERLHAFHHIEQPAARLPRFTSEEKRSLPVRKDQFLRANETVLDDMNLAGLRHAAEQDIRADPARASRSGGQRLSFLDDLADEKMLRYNEQIDDRKRLEIVIHQKQIRIVARGQTLTFRLEGAIDDPRSEFAFLALEFELLAAGRAEEIRERTVVGEGGNLRVAAVWAISPCAHPGFGPCPGALRTAGIGGLGFFEAEFHGAVYLRFRRMNSRIREALSAKYRFSLFLSALDVRFS